MAIITDFSKYNYTKITVPIYMLECPSDDMGERHFVNVHIDTHTQSNCTVGNRFVESISIERIIEADKSSAKWRLSMIVPEVLDEQAIFDLLRNFCAIISKQCSIYVYCASNGFRGFGFNQIDVHKYYSEDGITYTGNNDFRVGLGEITIRSTVVQNVFEIKECDSRPLLLQRIEDAYVSALKGGDMVSRYILLYRVIELIKGTEEIKSYRAQAENTLKSQGISTKEWQSLAICEFIKNEFGVSEYCNGILLTTEIVKQIIIVRNNMAHESDLTLVRRMLYDHFIPIVQAILRK